MVPENGLGHMVAGWRAGRTAAEATAARREVKMEVTKSIVNVRGGG